MREQLARSDSFREHVAQGRIFCAAAPKDNLQLSGFARGEPRQDEAPVSVSDSGGGESRGGCDNIFPVQSKAAGGYEHAANEPFAELFAPGRLGRRPPQIRVRHQFGEHFRRYLTTCGPSSVPIKCEPPMAQRRHDCIDDHVAGASIKCQNFVQFRARRKESEIGDAADVLDEARACGVGEQCPIGIGH